MTKEKPPGVTKPEETDVPKPNKAAQDEVVVELDVSEDFSKRLTPSGQPNTQANQTGIQPVPAPHVASGNTLSTWGDKLLYPVAAGVIVVVAGFWLERDNPLLLVTADPVDYSACEAREDKKHRKLHIYKESVYVDLLLSHNQDGDKTITIQGIKAEFQPRPNVAGQAESTTSSLSCDAPSQAGSTNTPDALDFNLVLAPNDIHAQRAVAGKKSTWSNVDESNLLPPTRGYSGLGLDGSVDKSVATKKLHIEAQGVGAKYQLRFVVRYTIGGEFKIAQSEWLLIDAPDPVSEDGLTKN